MGREADARDVGLSDPEWQAAGGRAFGAAPAIEVTRLADGRVTLAWPAGVGDFAVEQAGVLKTVSLWNGIPETPVSVGGRWSVTVPASAEERYFRLRQVDTGLLTVASTIPSAGEGTVSIRRWKLIKFCAKGFQQLLDFRRALPSS